MIWTDKNFICFPSVPWNYNWERQHEFIFFLASITSGRVIIHQPYGMINHNLKTIFQKFKSLSKALSEQVSTHSNPVLKNMEFVQTKFIPRHHNDIIDVLNAKRIEKATSVKFEESIVYATYVNSFTFPMFKKAKYSILDLAARRQTLHELSSNFKQLEKKAVGTADVVFVDNIMTMKDYSDLNPDINYLPQGVNPERFSSIKNDGLQKWCEGFDKVVGYSGSDIVMDYPLLNKMISENSDVLFLFVGNLNRPESLELKKYSNVRFTGRINYDDLGGYYSLFDVGLIPYVLNDRTSGVFPTKLFEYLAAGVPVLSTALPDLLEYNKDFVQIINSGNCTLKLKNLQTVSFDKAQLDSFVEENTWAKRHEVLLEKIGESL